MKLEDQVCSLSLAKRLKELGVKQDSFFVWDEDSHLFSDGEGGIRMNHHDGVGTAAFTVAELGQMFPPDFCFERHLGDWWVMWADGRFDDRLVFRPSTEADARAKMLIHLIEKGLVTP